MVARDRVDQSSLPALVERIRRLEAAAPLGFTSITRGSLRVASNEGLIVEGSAKVEGWLITTGTQRVVGRLEGSGTFDWTGASFLRGPVEITGLAKLLSDLRVEGGGKITVTGGDSPLTLENGAVSFGTGGRLEADTAFGGVRLIVGSGRRLYVGSGAVSMQYDGTNFVIVTATGTTVGGPFFASSKSFLIPHPTAEGKNLRHGSTESPVHGIEYWGDETLDDDGQLVVELPHYFEAIALERVPFVTARGFVADWSDVDDGRFTVTGTPRGRFSWLVKASRENFEVEPDIEAF